jgi:metal-responsive CopG/Arc/MetJ family transcriptional regulator
MSASRRRASRVFTISFPENLAKKVIAVAKDEDRSISELFREAFRVYRMEHNDRKLIEARAIAAKRVTHHYTEDDVEALVDDVRREQSVRRKRSA